MASKDVEELTAALEAASENGESEEAVSEEPAESSSSSEARREPSKGQGKSGSKSGASARIQELVSQTKSLEEELEALRGTVSEKDSELTKLVNILSEREKDHKAVQAIQELHASNPDLRPLIEALDKAVGGEEVDLQEILGTSDKDESPDKGAKEAEKLQKLLNATKDELTQEVANQKAELLLDKSDRVVDSYLDQLPEEYTEEDIRFLQRILPDHIDWEGIEDSPERLETLVGEGLQEALNWYGTPRGSAKAKVEGESEEKEAPLTKEQRMSKLSEGIGELKEVETPSGKRLQPVLSDEDFAARLGEALRLARE